MRLVIIIQLHEPLRCAADFFDQVLHRNFRRHVYVNRMRGETAEVFQLNFKWGKLIAITLRR